MMKIEFETNGKAFEDYGDKEVERILAEIAKEVATGFTGNSILDINGDKIGEWELN